MKPEHVERMANALLASLDKWIADAAEIAEAAHPTTGNKARALHLQRSMAQAKASLEHLLTLPPD
jgi:hypothetical protein